jgi:hypothetical protein
MARSTCTCNVGPGKFEGESALTFLAYQSMLLGCSDVSTGTEEHLIDWFKGPLNFDADHETVEAAEAYGYCAACIEEAINERPYGMSLRERSDGFVYGTVYETQAEYDAAFAEAEAEDDLPPCVLAMRCYCAGHARGNPVDSPCDTSEEVS